MIDWKNIEMNLADIVVPETGFTFVKKGFVQLADNQRVFVKIGIDENSTKWVKKEISVYKFLQSHSFLHTPKIMSHDTENTAFAIESLSEADGWNFSNTWTKERLDKTLKIVDELAMIQPNQVEKSLFTSRPIDKSFYGWNILEHSSKKQGIIVKKLNDLGRSDISKGLDFVKCSADSESFVVRNDTLTHNDLSNLNCPWNTKTKEVNFIDWDWTNFGDKDLDIMVLLVRVQMSGFDVFKDFSSRLDSRSLTWLAGFWFNAASDPIDFESPPEKRQIQLKSGIVATDMANRLAKEA